MDLEPVDGRDLGGVWVLDQLDRHQDPSALARKPAHRPGRKLDVALLERIIFALVAGRAPAPSSKLEATRWIREEVHIDRLAEVDHTACYRRWTGCWNISRPCRRRCSSPSRTCSIAAIEALITRLSFPTVSHQDRRRGRDSSPRGHRRGQRDPLGPSPR